MNTNALVARARELITTILVDQDEPRTDALIELLMIFNDEDIHPHDQMEIADNGIEHAFSFSMRFAALLKEYLQELKAGGYGAILAQKGDVD
jgi:hypothetical protein